MGQCTPRYTRVQAIRRAYAAAISHTTHGVTRPANRRTTSHPIRPAARAPSEVCPDGKDNPPAWTIQSAVDGRGRAISSEIP